MIAQDLLDQNLFLGVGNYIKSEALYRARISPWRRSFDLTTEARHNLIIAAQSVMLESYRAGGCTFNSYRNLMGPGKFADQLLVYGRKTDPLGNRVIRETTQDKRTSWWVPSLQK